MKPKIQEPRTRNQTTALIVAAGSSKRMGFDKLTALLLGKPVLQFDEVLRTYLSKLGINGHHLSISDERSVIVAFVVLESN